MLGLLVATDPRWARAAASDLESVLRDHAHCEMKAASHALSLAVRHPDDLAIVRRLTAIAHEELEHFDRVVALLAARGISLGPPPVDAYAAELRARAAKLPRTSSDARAAAVDRFLVCALIEARSCERFKMLLDALGDEHELHAFYKELFEAEAKHYREFCDLAARLVGEAESAARLAEIARIEADVVRNLPAAEGAAGSPTIHG
jgi:tRNA-(ms[2]io[6]A)-hydroxylase